jgi:hypothetical protein
MSDDKLLHYLYKSLIIVQIFYKIQMHTFARISMKFCDILYTMLCTLNTFISISDTFVFRHSKRLQEYLLRPSKKAKQASPLMASEPEDKGQAVALSQPTFEHAETPPAPPQQHLHYPQPKSPRQIQPSHTVPELEPSLHRQQSSRRPVIVSAADLSKSSDVSPLLQQLTSGGELEVTLSTPPASSSASSDSGVGSASSHRTSGYGEQTEVTHVSVKPVHARKVQQNAEERPHDEASCKRISYGVEQLSQPHQPEPSSFVPHERIPVFAWNREPSKWQGGKWTHVTSVTKLC